jgi:hypothetical protein
MEGGSSMKGGTSIASSKPITLLKRVFSEPCTAMDIPAIAPIKRGIRAGFINVLLFVSNF